MIRVDSASPPLTATASSVVELQVPTEVDQLAVVRPVAAPAAAREELITGCLPLAEHIARRFSGRGESREDLLQVARLGLVNAVDRFDVGRETEFISFAVPTIMGEIRRYFRDSGWAVRVP